MITVEQGFCIITLSQYAESIGKIQSNSEVRLDDPGIVKFFPPMEVEPYVEVNLLDSLLPAEENIELQVEHQSVLVRVLCSRTSTAECK